MATIKTTPLKMLDNLGAAIRGALPAALRPPFSVAFGTFRNAVAALPIANTEIDIPLPALPDIGGGGDPILPSPALLLQPIDPAEAVTEIARAVRDAERTLNEANLAIASATADVTLVVKVGAVAGAEAKLAITVSPVTEPVAED